MVNLRLKSVLNKFLVTSSALLIGLSGANVQAVAAPTYPGVLPGRGIQDYAGDLLGYKPGVPGLQKVKAWSESMRRYIPLEIVIPNNKPKNAPILYLVNGADGGEGTANWSHQTTWDKFFANKGTVVVQLMQGTGSYYTDWINDDPAAGRQKWETFMLHEVTETLEPHLGINPKHRGLIGYSMSVTSVFNLQITRPGFYKSVYAFSGCPEAYDPTPRQYIAGVTKIAMINTPPDPKLQAQEKNAGYLPFTAGNVANMWGGENSPLWRLKDPTIQAAKLRGTDMYIYSGTGNPGIHDVGYDPKTNTRLNKDQLQNQTSVGGQLEFRGRQCSVKFVNKLRSLNIPIKAFLDKPGTHSWGYWLDAMNNSWPYMARSLGGVVDGVKITGVSGGMAQQQQPKQ